MRFSIALPRLAVCMPLLGCFALCGASLAASADKPAASALKSGIDRSTFDAAVKPVDNFFDYVNGTWLKNNPIPAEYSRWGAFPKLRDDNLAHLRTIVEGLNGKNEKLDANGQKLHDFYATAMDEKK